MFLLYSKMKREMKNFLLKWKKPLLWLTGFVLLDKEKINAVRFTWCFYIENIVLVIDVESVFFQTFFAFVVGNYPEIFLIFFGKPHNHLF